jgi:hypothetical protein
LFSDEPVHPDHDILLDIAEFCELKEGGHLTPNENKLLNCKIKPSSQITRRGFIF